MMIVWSVLEVLFLFFFFQLPPYGEEEDRIEREERERAIQTKSQTQQSIQGTMNSPGSFSRREFSPRSITPSFDSSTESTHLVQSTKDMFNSLPNDLASQKRSKVDEAASRYGTFPEERSPVVPCGRVGVIGLMVSDLVYEETVVLLATLYFSLLADFVIEVSIHYVHIYMQ